MKFGVNLNRLGLEMHLVTVFKTKPSQTHELCGFFSSGNYFVEYSCIKVLD